MRCSFQGFRILAVTSVLAGQTLAAHIPSAFEITNSTISSSQHKSNGHSYKNAILEKKQDPTKMFSSNPRDPDYASIFADKNSMRSSPAYRSAEHHSFDTVLTIHNRERTTIGVWLEVNNMKMLMPGRAGFHNYIMIPPRQWALLRLPKNGGYGGTMRAFPGCDQNGWDCFGPANAATLLEWNTHTAGGDWWVNLSLVRGYNLGMTFEGRGPRHTCTTHSCQVPQSAVHKDCPSPNKIAGPKNGGDHVMCKSDCAVAEAPEFCCNGAFAPRGVCQPSNGYFAHYCRNSAYFWAYDDNRHMLCNPAGRMQVEIGGA